MKKQRSLPSGSLLGPSFNKGPKKKSRATPLTKRNGSQSEAAGPSTKSSPSKQAALHFRRFAKKSIKKLRSVKGGGAAAAAIESLCGIKNPIDGTPASNGPLRRFVVGAAANHLRNRLLEEPGLQLGIVEIEHEDWKTPLRRPEIDIGAVRKLIWPICSTIAPNFLAFVVPQISAPETDATTDAECSWSVVALVWHPELDDGAGKARTKFEPRLRAPEGKSQAIIFRNLRLNRSAIRTALLPFVSMAPSIDGGSETDLQSSALLWLRCLSALDIKRIVFAGGQGKAIKTQVAKDADQWLVQRLAGAGSVHPEAILQFWSGIMPLMGGLDFALPVVKYQNLRAQGPRKKVDEGHQKIKSKVLKKSNSDARPRAL